jgi:HSP20 family protein
MDIKKWVPWNWFKKEEDADQTLPVRQTGTREAGYPHHNPMARLHQEIDRLFDSAFRGFGLPWSPFGQDGPLGARMTDTLLKPTLDLGATDKEYTISVEIPGVDEKEISLEIANNTLTIRGEKKQEKEEKDKNYYRMERSYGAFQRVLALPEDADQEAVKAKFKRGVLTVTMPRRGLPQSQARRIDVKREE